MRDRLSRLFRSRFRSTVIDNIAMSPEVRKVFDEYKKIYGETARNFLRSSDYKRWSYVLSQIQGGGRLLDVGIGIGQFVYAAEMSGKFSEVVGVDIRPHSGLVQLNDRVELVWANAADLPFEDGEFEDVTCMECLEHMDDETFEAALSELRRVARRELMVTIPYDEPEPLPAGHLQRFPNERIITTFPDAEVTLLRRRTSKVPWALVKERVRH